MIDWPRGGLGEFPVDNSQKLNPSSTRMFYVPISMWFKEIDRYYQRRVVF